MDAGTSTGSSSNINSLTTPNTIISCAYNQNPISESPSQDDENEQFSSQQLIPNEIRLVYNAQRQKWSARHTLTDVNFVFESAKLAAHKFIVLDGPVYTWFLDRLLNDRGLSIIDIPSTITLDAVDKILSFIYGVSISDLGINHENVEEFLDAGNYFNMDLQLLPKMVSGQSSTCNQVLGTYVANNFKSLSNEPKFWDLENETILKLTHAIDRKKVEDEFFDWIRTNKSNRNQFYFTKLGDLIGLNSVVTLEEGPSKQIQNLENSTSGAGESEMESEVQLEFDTSLASGDEEREENISSLPFANLPAQATPRRKANDADNSNPGPAMGAPAPRKRKPKYYQPKLQFTPPKHIPFLKKKKFNESFGSPSLEASSSRINSANAHTFKVTVQNSPPTAQQVQSEIGQQNVKESKATPETPRRSLRTRTSTRRNSNSSRTDCHIAGPDISDGEDSDSGSDTHVHGKSRNQTKQNPPGRPKGKKTKGCFTTNELDVFFEELFVSVQKELGNEKCTGAFLSSWLTLWKYTGVECPYPRSLFLNRQRFMDYRGINLLIKSRNKFSSSSDQAHINLRKILLAIIENFAEPKEYRSWVFTGEVVSFVLEELKDHSNFKNSTTAGEILAYFLDTYGLDSWTLPIARSYVTSCLHNAITRDWSINLDRDTYFTNKAEFLDLIDLIKSDDITVNLCGLWSLVYYTKDDSCTPKRNKEAQKYRQWLVEADGLLQRHAIQTSQPEVSKFANILMNIVQENC